MEGHELRPSQSVPIGGKGKGKALASSEPQSPMEKSASPLSLGALLSDRPLFEEPLLNDPNEEVISSLGSVYGKEVTKKVLDLLRDSTPFQMAGLVSNLPYLCLSFLLFVLDIAITADEHFWHVHGEVLRRIAAPAKSFGSFEGGSP